MFSSPRQQASNVLTLLSPAFHMISAATPAARYQLKTLLPLILIAAVGATPLPRRLWHALQARIPVAAILYPIATALVLLLCTAYLVDSTFSPFAYTQF